MALISKLQYRRIILLHPINETTRTISSCYLTTNKITKQQQSPTMEKTKQGLDHVDDQEKKSTENTTTNHLKERHCKGDCDDGSNPRSISDEIMPHILNLYAASATPQDFEIYAPDATFEDPLMCARGVSQIKSAFYSLSKAFSESRIVEYTVTENLVSQGKHEILIDNKQYYKFMGKGIDMISLIKLDVEGGKVVRHEDRWDKKPLLNQETVKLPLAGRLIEMTRRGSMFITHALMRFGKDPAV